MKFTEEEQVVVDEVMKEFQDSDIIEYFPAPSQELFAQILYCERACIRHRLWHKPSIQTVGHINPGHQFYLMRVHRPVQYIKRITKLRATHISNDISTFGSTVLTAIYSA
ncbi:uncharacterized protein RHIMIDRAFT_294985 [Rhizopus microsporus ATCC 52813]|uniref:Uncharacterized protein n=1 Tax=Rhizopus microsporus ATCC 52813 TaxID=1340429 RepID=A0A2G4SIQ9_RHIZD|nr:uncharacterized protein RHIMIDRAFT_294985 [Rhizopus microsporus ATCC 52813]PHZ08668.1 hypothetical protein RHIMIDRAFT_294985 [Rhizopus microsporus ATCC 52813]